MKKTVKIKEGELVNMIDKIVAEAVAKSKKEWLAEQAKKSKSLLESRIDKLEAKLNAKK